MFSETIPSIKKFFAASLVRKCEHKKEPTSSFLCILLGSNGKELVSFEFYGIASFSSESTKTFHFISQGS